MSLIRGTALLGYPELVTGLGADADLLLRAAGVPIAHVGNPEAYLGYRNLITAVESAAKVTGTRASEGSWRAARESRSSDR